MFVPILFTLVQFIAAGRRPRHYEVCALLHKHMSSICQQEDRGSEGGRGLPRPLPGGGCRRSVGALHWIQLPHSIGLDHVWCGQVLEEDYSLCIRIFLVIISNP